MSSMNVSCRWRSTRWPANLDCLFVAKYWIWFCFWQLNYFLTQGHRLKSGGLNAEGSDDLGGNFLSTHLFSGMIFIGLSGGLDCDSDPRCSSRAICFNLAS